MRQSQLFTKTRKEAPADEVAKNAQLLIRAGYVHKEMAGVYAFLPLGLRVVEKIKAIVREEMGKINGQEIVMTAIQRKELWEKTDRWNDEVVDVWFKSKLHAGGDIGFGWSHEEPITDMMRNYVSSFRDLPIYVYQFQTKLRNELRAKSGIMRGREFVMKDLYSYDIDEASHTAFYNSVIESYKNVFQRVGVGGDTFVTFATGGVFTEFSHEFQTITDAGEDITYINREKVIALNEEVLNDETLNKFGIKMEDLEKVKTAEVGNIFNYGTKKCEDLDLYFTNENGERTPVFLGSYGIGITRLMGVLVEKFSDDKGIVWPEAVAPFKVHLVSVGSEKDNVKQAADALYEKLTNSKDGKGNLIEVLYDDRYLRPGEKFSDSDLLGMPLRVVISEKTLAEGKIELKYRASGEVEMITEAELLQKLAV